MRDVQSLDRHVIARRVETWAVPLRRPAIGEIPADLLLTGIVEEHDRTVLSFDLAVDRLFAPVPQLLVVGHTPLERDVRVLVQPWELARRELVSAFAVFTRVLGGIEPRGLAEARALNAADLHPEVETVKRIFSVAGAWHISTPFADG